jgi:hypothetical protein
LAFFDRFLVRLPPDLGSNFWDWSSSLEANFDKFPDVNNLETLNTVDLFVFGAIITGVEDDICGFGGGLDLLNVVVGFGGITNLLFTRTDASSTFVAALLGLTGSTFSISP